MHQGILSEAEFKALHQLRADHAPPPRGQMIEIGGARAYLTLPSGKPPFPAITVIHEWWGLNEHIQHWADRLAQDGYAALAVDLYGGSVATNADQASALMRKVQPAAAKATLLAAHRFLGEDARVKAQHRGVIGWCFGGHWSLELAIAAPDLDAAVMYYGQPITDAAVLASIHAPLLGIFGTQDTSIPPAKVAAFDAALTAAGAHHRILSYDAPHAFANPSNARYDEKAAAAAWHEVQAFFAAHLR